MILALALLACVPPGDGEVVADVPYLEVGDVVVRRLVYGSDRLRIVGMMARPPGEGPFPLVFFDHGAFAGMEDDEVRTLAERAGALQAVVAASMYRGEGGSEGAIEYCLGEVHDVLNLGLAVEQLVPLTGDAVAMGSSHGACISLMVNAQRHEQGAPLLATVTMGTPTDVDAVIAWHHAHGNPEKAETWEPYVDDDGSAQSPRFAALAPPLVLFHGLNDGLVPLEQACMLRDDLEGAWPVRSHRLTEALTPVAEGPVGDCQRWIDDGDPFEGLPDGLRLVTFEGAGHVPPQRVWDAAWDEVDAALR